MEAVLQPVKQQPSHSGGDGCGLVGLGQLGQVQPLAAQTLLRAEVDVVAKWAESTDDVHIRHAVSAGMVVLLSDAEQGSELGVDAGFLEDFTDCCGT